MLQETVIIVTEKIMAFLPFIAKSLDFLVPIQQILLAGLFGDVKPFRKECHCLSEDDVVRIRRDFVK